MIEIPKNDIGQNERGNVGQQPNLFDVLLNTGMSLQNTQEGRMSEQRFNISGSIKGPDEFGNFILNYTGTKRVLKSDGTLLCDKCFSEVVVCDYVYWCKKGKEVFILDPKTGDIKKYDSPDRIEFFKESEESRESLALKIQEFYGRLSLLYHPVLGTEYKENNLSKTENIKYIKDIFLGLYEYVYHDKLTNYLVMKNSKIWKEMREDITFQKSFPELYLAMFELDKYKAIRGGEKGEIYYVKSEGGKCICYKLYQGEESVHFSTDDFVVDYQNNIIVTQNGKKIFLGSEYPRCEYEEIKGPDEKGNYIGKKGQYFVFINSKGEVLDFVESVGEIGEEPGKHERLKGIEGPDVNGNYIIKHKIGEKLLGGDGERKTDVYEKIFPVDEKGNYKVIDIKLEGCNLINSKGEKKYDGWYKNIELKGDEYERIENKEIEIKYLGKEGEDLYEQAMAWKKAEEEKRKLEEEKRKAEEEKMRQEKEHKEAQEELGQEKFDSLLNLYERYDMVYGFSEGLALVMKDGKFGYIDKNGNEVVACKYDYAWDFREGLAKVRKNDKYGYVDKSGNEVVACKYDDALIFREGLAGVKKYGKFGYIDKSGNEVVACKYDDASIFREGLAGVKKYGKYGYIDKNGNEVVACKYDEVLRLDGAILAKEGKKRILFDLNGKMRKNKKRKEGQEKFDILLNLYEKYDRAWDFREGLAKVRKNDKYGYVDKNGNEVVACKYDYIENFSEGLAKVRKNDKYGYIDKSGNEVVACKYDDASIFREGLAGVKKYGKFGYIDKNGNEVVACKYDYAWDFSEGLAKVGKDGKYGYIDKNGNEVVACKYDDVTRLDGAILAKEGKRRILFDLDGKMRQERSESIDTPAEVLEFRRGFVDGIKKNNDVTQEKLKGIVRIGEELIQSKNFYFEKTAYGEMGVLKLGGKTMKFLNIAHPQDFNNQLTHKIKDKSLVKNFDYKAKWDCRCDNTQDLVFNKAMPGGSAEDAGIVELLGKIKDSIGLGQLTREEMEDTVRGILRGYCNQNGVAFSDSDDYMLLYMYLMGQKGGYGRQWLGHKNSSRSYFRCNFNIRFFNSHDNVYDRASFFLGLLV